MLGIFNFSEMCLFQVIGNVFISGYRFISRLASLQDGTSVGKPALQLHLLF